MMRARLAGGRIKSCANRCAVLHMNQTCYPPLAVKLWWHQLCCLSGSLIHMSVQLYCLSSLLAGAPCTVQIVDVVHMRWSPASSCARCRASSEHQHQMPHAVWFLCCAKLNLDSRMFYSNGGVFTNADYTAALVRHLICLPQIASTAQQECALRMTCLLCHGVHGAYLLCGAALSAGRASLYASVNLAARVPGLLAALAWPRSAARNMLR
jgi:hypothetical protein